MSDASPKPPPPRTVSLTTLILTAALAATTTAAVVLAVLYSTAGGDHRPNAGTASLPAALSSLSGPSPTPFVQSDTVKIQGHLAGEVFYAIPYAAPPHLTLTAPHRIYLIAKQDEYGFSWAADDAVDDFIDVVVNATTGEKQKQRKDKIEYEDFTWEAKGVPAGAGAGMSRPFEQTGTFQSVPGTQGQVGFEVPYATSPNVTLSGSTHTTVVVECTTTGFKWKNNGTDAFFNTGAETWTAKGIRASKLPQ